MLVEKNTSGAVVLSEPREILESTQDLTLDQPGSIRAEFRREQIVDDLIAKLPEMIAAAKAEKQDQVKLLKLDPIAHKPGILNWIAKLTSDGTEINPPKKYDHLHSDAYKRLWDHLVQLGLEPFIKPEFFKNDGYVPNDTTEVYLCAKLPRE